MSGADLLVVAGAMLEIASVYVARTETQLHQLHVFDSRRVELEERKVVHWVVVSDAQWHLLVVCEYGLGHDWAWPRDVSVCHD